MSTTVQLEGIESVVSAYQTRNIPAFAILQGRNLNFYYDGDDVNEGCEQLESWLNAISKSKATYTIKFLRAADIRETVRANTPDVGALNFRLNLDPIGAMGSVGNSSYLERRINDLEKRNDELIQAINDREFEVETETEQPVNNIIGTIKQLTEIPGFNEIVAGIIGIVTRGLQPAVQVPAATIGNVPLNNNNTMPDNTEITQTEMERAVSAFIHIRGAVPAALELLEKLAMKAQDNPAQLAKQIDMIKSFL